MKSLKIAGAVALLIASTASSFAVEGTGRISEINTRTGTLVLLDGSHFSLADPSVGIGFIPGDEVTFGYRADRGEAVVYGMTKVLPSSDDDDRGSSRALD